MATVNFSVPDEIKKEFDRTFAGTNKSRIIAGLMARAVEEERAARRRAEAVERLLELRRSNRPRSVREMRAAREAGRR